MDSPSTVLFNQSLLTRALSAHIFGLLRVWLALDLHLTSYGRERCLGLLHLSWRRRYIYSFGRAKRKPLATGGAGS